LEAEGNKTAPAAGENLQQIVKQLNFEKISFILKNQLPTDLASLNALEQVVLGKKTLSHQLQGLLEVLPKTDEAALLRASVSAALKAVSASEEIDPVDLQKQIKALKTTLTALSAQASEGAGTSAAREALTEVKNSLDFLGRLSETATFLHIPINLGQNTKSMDLYVQRDRSGKKKINPQDTKIFISLDTDHLQRVQCLVEMKDQHLSLGFRAADEDVLAALEHWFPSLSEALKQLGYPDARIQGTVIKKPLSLLDIVQDPMTDRQIDLRV
jgi:flagellar hook-length control protein FliK